MTQIFFQLCTIFLSSVHSSSVHYDYDLVDSMLQRNAIIWMNQLDESIQNTNGIKPLSDQQNNFRKMYQIFSRGLVTNYHRIKLKLPANNKKILSVIISALTIISKNEMILDQLQLLGANTKNPMYNLWIWASHSTKFQSSKCRAISTAMQPIMVIMSGYTNYSSSNLDQDYSLLLKKEFTDINKEILECKEDVNTLQLIGLKQQFVSYLKYLMSIKGKIKSSFKRSNIGTLLKCSLETVRAINNRSDAAESEGINQIICDIITETFRISPPGYNSIFRVYLMKRYPELLTYFCARRKYHDLRKRVCLYSDLMDSEPNLLEFLSGDKMNDIRNVLHLFYAYTLSLNRGDSSSNVTSRFNKYKVEDCVDLLERVVELVLVIERELGMTRNKMDWGMHNITRQIKKITCGWMHKRVLDIINKLEHDQWVLIDFGCCRLVNVIET